MKSKYTTAKTLLVCSLFFFSQEAMSFSLLEWFGFGKEKEISTKKPDEGEVQKEIKKQKTAEVNKVEETTARGMISLGGINSELEIGELKLILANLPEEKRKQLLSSPEAFSQLAKHQMASKSLLKAIRANKLESNPNTQFIMQKAAENALQKIYINRLISQKIPNDFPNAEQIEKFYNENKQQFAIAERIHLWQIFLPFENETDIEAIKALEKTANSIKNDLEKGKADFALMAEKHSSHLPSRHNGGYMGLVNVADLIPAIKDRVLSLEEGKISKPIKTENGIHIMKRGGLIQAQALSLDQSKGRIRNALRQEAAKRLRQAIIKKAQETYPSEINEKKIEEWRLKLRTNL